jgi:hypothetical protein
MINNAIINVNEDKGGGSFTNLEDHQAYLLMGLAESGIARDLHVTFKAMCDIFGAKAAGGGHNIHQWSFLGGRLTFMQAQ